MAFCSDAPLLTKYRPVWKLNTPHYSVLAPLLHSYDEPRHDAEDNVNFSSSAWASSSAPSRDCSRSTVNLLAQTCHLAADDDGGSEAPVQISAGEDVLIFIAENALESLRNTIDNEYGSRFPTVVDECGACALHIAAATPPTPEPEGDGTDESGKASQVALMDYVLTLPGALEWITHRDGKGLTPLMVACAAGLTSNAARLLKFLPTLDHVNAANSKGVTALHIALDNSNPPLDLVALLLRYGADCTARALVVCDSCVVDVRDWLPTILIRFGCTPVEYALIKQAPPTVVQALLDVVATSGDVVGEVSGCGLGSVRGSSSDDARLRDEQHQRQRTVRAVATACAAEGSASLSTTEARNVLLEVLDGNVTDDDVRLLSDAIESAQRRGAGVWQGNEEAAGSVRNAASPAKVAEVVPLEMRLSRYSEETGSSDDVVDTTTKGITWQLVKRTAETEGSFSAIDVALQASVEVVVPNRLRRMLHDAVLVLDVLVHDVLELTEVTATELETLLSTNTRQPAKRALIFLATTTSATPLLRNERTLNALLILNNAHAQTFHDNGSSGGVSAALFRAPSSLPRSLLELPSTQVVDADEAIAFSCATRDRFVLERSSGVSGIVPFNALFSTYRETLSRAVAVSRVQSIVTRCASSYSSFRFGRWLSAFDDAGRRNTNDRSSCGGEHATRQRLPSCRLDLLTSAIRTHCDAMVNFLLSCPSISRSRVDLTHLVVAAGAGTAAALQLVFSTLGSDASLFSQCDDVTGETPVTAAVGWGTCLHLTSLLRLASRALQATNANGFSPLMIACLTGHESAALQLISLGANVNEIGRFGMTPLIASIAGPLDRLATTLVGNGAHVSQADANGLTPVMAATFFGSSALTSLLHSAEKSSEEEERPLALQQPDSLVVADNDDAAATTPATTTTTFSTAAAAAATTTVWGVGLQEAASLTHVLNHFFAVVAHVAPQLGIPAQQPACEPQNPIPVVLHDVNLSTVEHQTLIVCLYEMCNEMSIITRATLLESSLRGLASDNEATLLFTHFLEGLRRTVTCFHEAPPVSQGVVALVEHVLQVQQTLRQGHRFVAAVQRIAGGVAHPAERSVAWRKALQGSSIATPHRICAPTSLVISAWLSSSCELRESDELHNVLRSWLDPCGTGWTTVFEAAWVAEVLELRDDSNATAESILGLKVLLGGACQNVHVCGCDALARFWLARSVDGYVVMFAPEGVVVLSNERTTSAQSPSDTTVTQRSYRNVASLLAREHAMLRFASL